MDNKNDMRPKEWATELAKALCDRGNGYLVIECEFFKLMKLYGFDRTLTDVLGGCILSRTVSDGAKALVDLVSYFSRQDASRFTKGVEFLNAKYPHAVFFFHGYVLGVANLTPEEIKDCLDQVGIGFGYVQEKIKSV
ncbi:MAG TPA: hypothetical protein VL728_06690 [Cyclobacteriaceae bacterium]|jgi:hypothetical protein|nr:hypothetical protein [Cyclobacteriaceae bacterium]